MGRQAQNNQQASSISGQRAFQRMGTLDTKGVFFVFSLAIKKDKFCFLALL